jgi:hemerythrin-like domain-containing protein
MDQKGGGTMNPTRRELLSGLAFSGATLLLSSCAGRRKPLPGHKTSDDENWTANGDVTAVEDLMREHGVLRRALLVYAEAARKPAGSASARTIEALRKTALLFRSFGEDYHEKLLEEAAVFPAVRSASGLAAACVDVLTAQHRRGREITDAVLSMTRRPGIGSSEAEPLGRMMSAFVRMYQNHAAREDTFIFPAWKQALSAEQLAEAADRFEDIERRMFGTDGFGEAVRKIEEIEETLGLADLAQFTAPPPAAE